MRCAHGVTRVAQGMEGRISLAPLRSDDTLAVLGGDYAMDASVATAVRGSARAQLAGSASRGRDKSERATVETVLDPRTRLVRLPAIAAWHAYDAILNAA